MRSKLPRAGQDIPALFLFLTLYLGDWLTTLAVLENGGQEANPFLQYATLDEMLALKVAVAPWIFLLLSEAKKLNANWYRILILALLVWYGFIVSWNLDLVM